MPLSLWQQNIENLSIFAVQLHTDPNLVGHVRQRKSSYKKNLSKCNFCGGPRHTSSNSPEDRQKLCKAFGKICSKCGKQNHLSSVCQSARNGSKVSNIETEESAGDPNQMSSITADNLYGLESLPAQCYLPSRAEDLLPTVGAMRNEGPVTYVPLPHHVHDKISGWLQTKPRDSPSLPVSFSIDHQAYSELGLAFPRRSHNSHASRVSSHFATADSGAQLTVIPASVLESMKVKLDSIFPVQAKLNGANNAPIMVEGGILLKISSTNPTTQVRKTSHQLCYVSRHVTSSFLSLSCCVDLGLLPATFPEVGSCDPVPPASLQSLVSPSPTRCYNSGVPGSPTESTCSCPRRELPPQSPPILPCAPTPDNVEQLRNYILDRYKASAFNCCEHQPLRLMDGSPPLRVFVDDEASPVAVHSPSQIPLHWQKQVKDGLDRDVRLGVLERVPVNDPVTWCSRMVITPKPDGSPRRVVDYTSLNKHAPRQTHHTESPWSIVSSVPPNKVKSVLDCWHGYHSVPLHPADRHLTTFITPYGRYRYKTCPQGLISAGDAYTQRKSEMMEGFENQKTCVDDTILYDDTIEQNFYRVCQFLETAARGGCTFNPKKFQFGSSDVNFLGFLVTKDGIKPSKEFLNNILSFPAPRNITDVRSWFGAINQISYTFAIAPLMAPFRHLLSAKVPFQWTPELQTAFDESKQEILRQCEKGVRSFDPSLPTALATDWAKFGLGFWLTQKHCSCSSETPGCCQTGWQTVYCGSRFCSAAESRYHPIEGEALATVNGLDKCRFFVLGLPNLILCLDHKPLLGILGDKNNLEDIHNPRLLNFKLKSMLYKFKVTHVPGKKNVIPDTFSRRGDSPANKTGDQYVVTGEYANSLSPPTWVSSPTLSAITSNTEELLQGDIIASLALINSSVSEGSDPDIVTWQRLEAACLSDEEYIILHRTVSSGVPEDKSSWDSLILDYFPHRHSLVTVGPVVMLHDRPVIPKPLRPVVMDHLHAGHASATAMFERASTSLYWPNFRQDLINFRAACRQCSRFAPSNPAMPPIIPEDPTYPFQSLCADFFTLDSRNYFVVVDRYSNWLTVFKLAADKTEEVIRVMRQYISTFGIPATFTSDGARVFTSKLFEDFCSKWGIVHRVSTAYNPRANKRAELAVKHAKRIIRGNTSQTGTLDTDKLVRAVLMHRNTPCSITGLSPAQVVFGRAVRDPLPLQPSKLRLRQDWRQAADNRAEAYSHRKFTMQETLSRGSRQLPPLKPGDHVLIQDQHGNSPKQWSKTGVIIEVGPYDSYIVSVDGSRQVTKRNRRYLRLFKPNTSYEQKVSESCQDPPRLRPRPASPAQAPPLVTPPPVKLVPAPATEPLPPPSPTPAVPPLVLRRSNNEWEVAQQQQLSLLRSSLPYYPPTWPQFQFGQPLLSPYLPHIPPIQPHMNSFLQTSPWISNLPSYSQQNLGGDIKRV